MSGKQQQQPVVGPQTVINPTPEGIQIIVAFAPQVHLAVVLSLEQMKAAMERCLQMRVQQSLVDKEAASRLIGRKDLKAV